jgi:hypothetical protein
VGLQHFGSRHFAAGHFVSISHVVAAGELPALIDRGGAFERIELIRPRPARRAVRVEIFDTSAAQSDAVVSRVTPAVSDRAAAALGAPSLIAATVAPANAGAQADIEALRSSRPSFIVDDEREVPGIVASGALAQCAAVRCVALPNRIEEQPAAQGAAAAATAQSRLDHQSAARPVVGLVSRDIDAERSRAQGGGAVRAIVWRPETRAARLSSRASTRLERRAKRR